MTDGRALRRSSTTRKTDHRRGGRSNGDDFRNGSTTQDESRVSRSRSTNMEAISKKLAGLDGRRQDLTKRLDEAQSASNYDEFRKIGNSYLGTILESIDLYIDLIREISSETVAGELKNELSEIVTKGSKSTAIESQSQWISDDVSPLYEKVRQICACVYAAVAKIDQDANRIA